MRPAWERIDSTDEFGLNSAKRTPIRTAKEGRAAPCSSPKMVPKTIRALYSPSSRPSKELRGIVGTILLSSCFTGRPQHDFLGLGCLILIPAKRDLNWSSCKASSFQGDSFVSVVIYITDREPLLHKISFCRR